MLNLTKRERIFSVSKGKNNILICSAWNCMWFDFLLMFLELIILSVDVVFMLGCDNIFSKCVKEIKK